MSYKASNTIENEQRRLRLMSLLGQEITQRMLENAKQRLGPDTVKILDAGCGTGESLTILKDFFPEGAITGVDISEKALAQAREKGVAEELIKADLSGFKNPNQFDLIFMQAVLMHIGEPQKVLANLKESLAGRGVLAVFEPDYHGMNSPFPEFPTFKKTLVATMQGYGIDPYLGSKLVSYLSNLGFLRIKEFAVNLKIMPREEGWGILLALCEVAGPAMLEFIPILEKTRQDPKNVFEFKGKMAVVAQKS